MIQEDVGAVDVVENMAEDDLMGEVEDEVVNDITLMQWQRTMILTTWQKQRFIILVCTSH